VRVVFPAPIFPATKIRCFAIVDFILSWEGIAGIIYKKDAKAT
jgi:hypothetical protein